MGLAVRVNDGMGVGRNDYEAAKTGCDEQRVASRGSVIPSVCDRLHLLYRKGCYMDTRANENGTTFLLMPAAPELFSRSEWRTGMILYRS